MSLRGRLFALTYDRQLARAEDAGLRAMRLRLLAVRAGRLPQVAAQPRPALTARGCARVALGWRRRPGRAAPA